MFSISQEDCNFSEDCLGLHDCKSNGLYKWIFHWAQMPPGKQGAPMTSYYTSPVYWVYWSFFPSMIKLTWDPQDPMGFTGFLVQNANTCIKGKGHEESSLPQLLIIQVRLVPFVLYRKKKRKQLPCFNLFIYQYNMNELASILWEKYSSFTICTS